MGAPGLGSGGWLDCLATQPRGRSFYKGRKGDNRKRENNMTGQEQCLLCISFWRCVIPNYVACLLTLSVCVCVCVCVGVLFVFRVCFVNVVVLLCIKQKDYLY